MTPASFPDVFLPSTSGHVVNLRQHPGRSIVFIYPYTGRPGVPDPQGWDHIPGAHGSTPQALTYKSRFPDFTLLDTAIFGVSQQPLDWQQEFATRNALPFQLLSDSDGHFSAQLSLKLFQAGGRDFLQRRTFVGQDGKIIHDRAVITDPAADADAVLDWLKQP